MNHEKLLRYGTASAILTSSALLLNGSAAETTPKMPESVTTIELPGDTAAEYESPSADCNPNWVDYTRDISDAQKCLDEYAAADIALINYDLDAAKAENLATNLEQKMTHVTDGLISIDVQVVTPSDEARKLFKEKNAGGCVDENNLYHYGSYIASSVMPELARFDKIVAESDTKACTETTAGVAFLQYNRYVDMFNTLPDPTVEKSPADSLPEIANFKPRERDLGYIGLHEILHLYGLSHAGNLYSNGTDIAGRSTGTDETMTKTIDLTSMIAEGSYYEYGDTSTCNAMANYCDNTDLENSIKLNQMQKDVLRLPERLVHPDSKSSERMVGVESTYLDPRVGSDVFASFALPKGITMPNSQYGSASEHALTKVYNRLNFTPSVETGNGSYVPNVWAMNVYLTSDVAGLSSVSLGRLMRGSEGTRAYDIVVDGQTINVQFDGVGVLISAR